MPLAKMDEFHVFQELPKDLRILVWEHAASVPRIVEVSESHSLMSSDSKEKFSTNIVSRTRPPALLGVCQESRHFGLTMYTAMDEGIRTKEDIINSMLFNIPIYVNPRVDIVYRSKGTCATGAAFALRCEEWIDHTRPVATTKTLAVDLAAISGHAKDRAAEYLRITYDGDQSDRLGRELARLKLMTTAKYIAACAAKGVRHIMLVVGNDDDASEVILEPLSNNVEAGTERGKRAKAEVSNLQNSLIGYWADHTVTLSHIPVPTVSVVAVKRKPLRSFHSFSSLPTEIQDMIWKHVLLRPRLLTLATVPDSDAVYLPGLRQPAVAQVCRASRKLCINQMFAPLGSLGEEPFFRPYVDTVRIEVWDGHEPRDFAEDMICSLGIAYKYCSQRFFGSESKAFKYLREIVILLGRRQADYEMELVPVNESEAWNIPYSFKAVETANAVKYAGRLRKELEENAKKWKTYQKGRTKKGKPSPDYVVPTVRIARMQAICENESPYTTGHYRR